MGFVGENTYLADNWNRLDFLVVATSILEYLPVDGVEVGFLRTFRVLRPLKSLNSVPELQRLVVSMMKALQPLMYTHKHACTRACANVCYVWLCMIPTRHLDLQNPATNRSVVMVLLFTFTIFGIAGVNLFGTNGAMHYRCRATPYPVTLDWNYGDDPADYACLSNYNGLSPEKTVVDCVPVWFPCAHA